MDTNTNQSVHVNKDFPISVETLYNAWISPEALRQWCAPIGNRLTKVKNDVKEGGAIEYKAENENGDYSLLINGRYEEVKEKERLVYSWDWKFPNNPLGDSVFKVTVVFSQQDNGSSVEVKQENLKDEEAILIHQQGWERSLNNLHQYLSSQAG